MGGDCRQTRNLVFVYCEGGKGDFFEGVIVVGEEAAIDVPAGGDIVKKTLVSEGGAEWGKRVGVGHEGRGARA